MRRPSTLQLVMEFVITLFIIAAIAGALKAHKRTHYVVDASGNPDVAIARFMR
jgi:hypothetical protein